MSAASRAPGGAIGGSAAPSQGPVRRAVHARPRGSARLLVRRVDQPRRHVDAVPHEGSDRARRGRGVEDGDQAHGQWHGQERSGGSQDPGPDDDREEDHQGAQVQLGAHHAWLQQVVLGHVDEGEADHDERRRDEAALQQRQDRRRHEGDDGAHGGDEGGREGQEGPQRRKGHTEHQEQDEDQHRREEAELGPHDQVAPQVDTEALHSVEDGVPLAEGRGGAFPERGKAGQREDHRGGEDEDGQGSVGDG